MLTDNISKCKYVYDFDYLGWLDAEKPELIPAFCTIDDWCDRCNRRKEKYHERKDTRAVNDPYILFHPFDRNESQHKDHEEARHIENYLTDAEICTILAACHRRTDHYDTHYRKNRDE